MDNANKQSYKRIRSDSGDSESVPFPHFLVIQSDDPDKPLKISPFAISKGIEGLIGSVKTVKRLRSGDILVEVIRASQANSLLKVVSFANNPVKVSPHKTLNSCRGVVRCPELRDCDDEEILEELADQHVTDVHRVTINQNGVKRPTNTLFLTFNTPKLPQDLQVGYLRVKIAPYIPNPIRCFKCQKFGHFRSNCQRSECCEKCGKTDHVAANCQDLAHCINCSGNHSANSRVCPKWIEEKRIQEIKTVGNLSYPEARKLYQVQNDQSVSYASVAKQSIEVNKPKPKVTATTQTDLTWIIGDNPALFEDSKSTNTDKAQSLPITTDKAKSHPITTDKVKSHPTNTANIAKSQLQKQGSQKKDQSKTKDDRRSRSLSRDPPVRNTSDTSHLTKQQPVKVKGKTQINVSKPKLSDSVKTKNKFDVLSVEGDEVMDFSPHHHPDPKIKLVPRLENT